MDMIYTSSREHDHLRCCVFQYMHYVNYEFVNDLYIESKTRLSTDGGERTSNIYDCQDFKQVFTGVSLCTFPTNFHGSPQNFKQVSTGVIGVPVTRKI